MLLTPPKNENELVQLITMGKSIRRKWVKRAVEPV